jgi:hypothetical protein
VNLEQRFKESIKAQQWAHTLPVIAWPYPPEVIIQSIIRTRLYVIWSGS